MERVTELECVTVVGAGARGAGIAWLSALAGFPVRLYDADPISLERAVDLLRGYVEQAVSLGYLCPGDRQRTLDGILATSDLDEAVTHADLVIETSSSGAEKQAVLTRLGETCRASALLATTGLAAPASLARGVPQPGRIFGLRVPEPMPLAGVLAVVAGPETDPEALHLALGYAARLGHAVALASGVRVEPRA